MRYIVIGIIILMFCILIALLENIFDTINLRKRVKTWIKDFRGVIH